MRVIKELRIDFGPPEGDYRYLLDEKDGCPLIGGKPFPSEAQAHSFGIFVRAVEKLVNWPIEDVEKFINWPIEDIEKFISG